MCNEFFINKQKPCKNDRNQYIIGSSFISRRNEWNIFYSYRTLTFPEPMCRVSRCFTFVKCFDTFHGYKQGQKAETLTAAASALNFKFVKKFDSRKATYLFCRQEMQAHSGYFEISNTVKYCDSMMLFPCMEDQGGHFFLYIDQSSILKEGIPEDLCW